MAEVERNEAEGRFEIRVGDDVAFADYRIDGGSIVFPHTVVPEAFQGRGFGRRLVEAGLGYARQEGLKVVPRCSFFQRHIARHPEFRELVHPDHLALVGG